MSNFQHAVKAVNILRKFSHQTMAANGQTIGKITSEPKLEVKTDLNTLSTLSESNKKQDKKDKKYHGGGDSYSKFDNMWEIGVKAAKFGAAMITVSYFIQHTNSYFSKIKYEVQELKLNTLIKESEWKRSDKLDELLALQANDLKLSIQQREKQLKEPEKTGFWWFIRSWFF